MLKSEVHTFPRSRIATIDVFAVGKRKHHIPCLIEVDVTLAMETIKTSKAVVGKKLSFTAWLIKVIGHTIKVHETAAAYRNGKRRLLIFNQVHVSLLVEKELNGYKIPIPLLLEDVNEKNVATITGLIQAAKASSLTDKDIVLQRKAHRMERYYYLLPGFIRRLFWHYLLGRPRFAFAKMGNVAVTAVGMMGHANGWFIPSSVHPLSFGISAVTPKPVVMDGKVVIRDMLQLTILMDHDVIDGAQMARFVSNLSENMSQAVGLI
jgi:pyruvate/2-oxoglutarate dehydrogenase complex dihydrolipoamide acyltransferase (E2) component